MSKPQTYWVLGHRITPAETMGDYALLHATTLPGVPGPPPHHHTDAAEMFLVIRGRLEVMMDGRWTTLSAGQSACVPPGVVHTFRNPDDQPCEWVTAFSPRGFEQFFLDFGVPVERAGAFEASVTPDMIARVISDCGKYGMILAQQAAPEAVAV